MNAEMKIIFNNFRYFSFVFRLTTVSDEWNGGMRYFLLAIWASLCTVSSANYPVFDGAAQLKELFIPADVHIGSAIYRLRASDSDHDYPLQFDATGKRILSYPWPQFAHEMFYVQNVTFINSRRV